MTGTLDEDSVLVDGQATTIRVAAGHSVTFDVGHVHAIEDLSRLESESILRLLYEHIATPEHVVRWRWRAGDIAFWDNRATCHYAAADYDGPRVMHRITVAGDRPLGIA